MNTIIIEKTHESPRVVLDADANFFEIAGRSLPEDASKFYNPIKDWFVEYIKAPNQSTTINFNLDYFNSSSARLIVKILIEFEPLIQKGFDVKIIWQYKQNDDVMFDRGEEIKTVLNIPFEFVVIK